MEELLRKRMTGCSWIHEVFDIYLDKPGGEGSKIACFGVSEEKFVGSGCDELLYARVYGGDLASLYAFDTAEPTDDGKINNCRDEYSVSPQGCW